MKLDTSGGTEKNYQPVVIRFLNKSVNGIATNNQIKEELQKENQDIELPRGVLHTVTKSLIGNNIIKSIDDSFQLIGFEEFNDAEKAWITNYCNEKIDKSIDTTLSKDSVNEIILEFKEWLKTDAAQNHLKIIENEKIDVKNLMKKLSSMNKTSIEFTDEVLYALLPYHDNSFARRKSTFPVFRNIRAFLKGYNYSEDDWNKIANIIFDLASSFSKEPEKLEQWIQEFKSNNEYTRMFQTGALTPILFCINDSYPLINNRIRRTYKEFSKIYGWDDKISRFIEEYPENINKIHKFINELNIEEFKDLGTFDLFCYWYDYIRQTEPTGELEEEETESIEKEITDIDFNEFLSAVNLKDKKKFDLHHLPNPDRIRVRDIIQNCSKAKWKIPNFQRYFDWSENDIRSLLESMFKDYYVGAFLLWDKNKDEPLRTEPILGAFSHQQTDPESIILDGQQRITSLYYAIQSPNVETNKIKNPVYFYIDFNSFFIPESKNQKFVTVNRRKFTDEECFKKLLFPFYELTNYEDWLYKFEEFVENMSIENKDKLRQIRRIMQTRLNHFFDGFEIPYITLPGSMTIGQVADIFEQINTKGKPLNVFDLLNAKLSTFTIELKTLWEDSIKNNSKIKEYKSLDKLPIYILQAISLKNHYSHACGKDDLLTIYENVFETSEISFDDEWEEMSGYVNDALLMIENLRDGFGVKNRKNLPYAPTIPIVAALLREISEQANPVECNKKLDNWYWSVVFGMAFSGGVDSQLTKDFTEMLEWFKDDEKIPSIVTKIRNEFHATIHLKDVQTTSNAIFRGIMSLIALKGGIDFNTNKTLENARENDKHHIFPKAAFKIQRIGSVLNYTWLSAETNRKILGATKPSIYVKNFIKEKFDNDEIKFKNILESHLIDDTAFHCMLKNDFDGFINAREQLLMNEIGKRLGIDTVSNSNTMLRPDREFDNELLVEDTFKKCDEYIDWVDGYFRQKGFTWISRYLPNDKVKQVRILTGKDTVNDELRDRFKALKSQLGHNEIKCEMRVINDNKIKRDIHGRWIVTKNNCFSFQSVDTVSRGSYDEIRGGAAVPPFDKWWDGSLDIINDWNKIKETIEEN
jgi:hypothetical protein